MPSPAPLTHLLISASAGSGKTYQLVQRYLHLLALGEEADGIAAMTFTRKAAGEFFSRILQRLAVLAEAPTGAAAYFKGAEPPISGQPDFQAMLRRVTRRMHRLRLGTMDSFFGHMAACFPLELGLPAGARVMDEEEAALARRDALEAMLERLYLDDAKEALQLLVEAYKQATFGAEEKSVDASLQEWAASGLALWEDCGAAAAELWGHPPRIWPAGSPARRPPEALVDALPEVLNDLRAHFQPNSKNGIRFLDELIEQAPLTMPGLPLPDRVEYFLKKCQDAWEDLQSGTAQISWGAKMTVSGGAARAFVRLAEVLMAREFLVRAERTRGLGNLMTLFAAEYDRGVRARGRLTFADVQRLLCAAATGASPWMQGGGDLWFRMDGKHQHWLLDEFQDTSRVQWRVISGLVDEVIQDAEGARSFFAVGDPKQSIYLWRQAEPGLFDDILTAYPANGHLGLRQKPLFESHRSAQPVLDAVNAVFGDAAALEALLPPQSTKGFSFTPHVAVHKDMTGGAALLSPAGTNSAGDPLTTNDVTAALLRQIEPLRRGLSCAILVRQNKDAQVITEELRELTGMEVVCESNQHPCTDNAVTLALLSLLSLAAHPGDGLALEHLKMSPLWPQVAREGRPWRYEIAVIQSLVFEEGFAACLEAWTPRVRAALPEMDAFHARRLAQMADIAAEFDATGNRDIDAFLEFAREYPLRTRGARRAIQVMTVHAAKGLEFDVVILPKLDDTAMNEVRHKDLLISRDEEGRVRWVLQTPLKAYSRLDDTLAEELLAAQRRGAFESLCRLYVAMTRAKRGLYLIADVPPKDGKALKESKLLREVLGAPQAGIAETSLPAVIEWETGARDWYAACAEVPAPVPQPAVVHAPLGPLLRATQPMPRRRTPSGEESFHLTGTVLFSEGRETGRQLGTLVHALLAEVEFTGPSAAAWRQHWQTRGYLTESIATEREAAALKQALNVLQSADCAAAFQPLAPRTLVWRERPFDLMLDGEWVSGIFDRVMIALDDQGQMTAAWIIDFKTDDPADAAALQDKIDGYAPQLALYRQTFARLTALPSAQIRTSLLFTRTGKLVEVG